MQLLKKMVPSSKQGSFQLLIILFLYIFANLKVSVGLDTISPGQPLYRNQTIISKKGKFELGFFSPGTSSYSYVGIWYKYVSYGTIVWVANKQAPIRQFSDNSRLVLAEDGGLILFSDLNEKIWSVNNSVLSSVPNKGVLLDDGNFVLSDGFSTIWQSFDDTTDTWLPGKKVGIVDSFTNKGQLLTSWKNRDDPAPGSISLGMDPTGSPELFMWMNQSQKIWRSGAWNGSNFASFPALHTNFSYNLNGQAKYLTYVVNKNITTRFVLNDNGIFTQLVWSDSAQEWSVFLTQPINDCGFALCGSFGLCDINSSPICQCYDGFKQRFPEDWRIADWSSGCIRNKPLTCSADGFKRMAGISMPANARTLDLDSDIVCRYACLDNCTCSAYSYSGGRCSLWNGDLIDTRSLGNNQDNSQVDLYVRSSDVPSPRVSKNKKPSYVPVALSTTIPLLICTSLIYLLWNIRRTRNKKKKDAKETSENLLLLNLEISTEQNTDGNSITHDSTLGEKKISNLPQFSFSSISAATNNFSPANKLGEGGFGPVYKGNLAGGKSVAVKRLSKRSGQGLEELRNETVLIAKLQHRNLVRLLGCCIEQDEKILVYEYMSNKSLDRFIFDPSKQTLLDWRRRVQIIEGITQGLLYLHQHSRLRIVHRDLKASNVLLDDEMNPKISDFGMARIFWGDELQANTNRIVGTYGYMSPEYAMEGLFSIKSDVFAFGVLVLEILSGKKNTGFRNSDCLNLLGYAWELWKDNRVLELVDSNLDIPSTFVPLRFIHVALLCVQEFPADRPTMSDVLSMFSNEHVQLVSPKRPAFTSGGGLASGIDKSEIFSANNLTASFMDGR